MKSWMVLESQKRTCPGEKRKSGHLMEPKWRLYGIDAILLVELLLFNLTTCAC